MQTNERRLSLFDRVTYFVYRFLSLTKTRDHSLPSARAYEKQTTFDNNIFTLVNKVRNLEWSDTNPLRWEKNEIVSLNSCLGNKNITKWYGNYLEYGCFNLYGRP
jgi:hypothetical protein